MGLEIDRPSEGDVIELPFTVSGTCPLDHEVSIDVGGMYGISTVASGTSFSAEVPSNMETGMIAGEVTIVVTCPVSERTTVGVTIERQVNP